MKVFLSWSGDTSKRVAEVLREWLPNVVQAIQPWMSAEDIDKGARWSSDIASELANTKAGIVCITPTNQDAPWLNFEAGALSKTVDKAMVCPYLVGVKPTDLKGPLVQFQAAAATQSDTRKLLVTLNRALGDEALTEKQLNKTFDVWWPELAQALETLSFEQPKPAPARSERELIEEILGIVREQAKQQPKAVIVASGRSERQPFQFWATDELIDWNLNRFLRHRNPQLFFVEEEQTGLVADLRPEASAPKPETQEDKQPDESDRTKGGA